MKPNAQRAKIAEYLIWITMGAEIISLITNFLQYLMIRNAAHGIYSTIEEVERGNSRVTIVTFMSAIVMVISMVTYLMWFYRAYANQRQLFFMANTKGWAIGAWIVPIVSLFKPYQMMKEMYTNAENHLVEKGLDTTKPRRFTIIGLWWTCWIIYGIGSNIGSGVSNARDLNFLATIYIILMVISAFFAILCILAVKVIRNYNEMELILIEMETGHTPENTELLDSF